MSLTPSEKTKEAVHVSREIQGLGGESSYGVGGQLYRLLYGSESIGISRPGKRTSQRETQAQRKEIRHPDGRVEFIEQVLIQETIYEEWEN